MCINYSENTQRGKGMKDRIPQLKMNEIILEFQKTEKELKAKLQNFDCMIRDVEDPEYIDNFVKEIKEEQYLFNKYKSLLSRLPDKDQKIYFRKVQKYQTVVAEHSALYRLSWENPQQFEEYVKEKTYLAKRINEPEWKFLLRGLFGILGAFLIHILIGAIYRWPMINPYVTSYYKITNDPDLRSNFNSIGTPVFIFSVGITMKLGMKLNKIIGKMPVLFLPVFMLAGVLYISHMVPTFLLFIIFHNFLYGLFSGFLFLTPLSQCQKYFPNWALVINSFILTGTGLGSVFFGSMNVRCMNPQLYLPTGSGYFSGVEDYIAHRLPHCINSMSLYVLCIGLVGCLLIWRLCRYNDANQITHHQIKWPTYFEFSCYSEEQALKSPVFWKIIGVVILCCEGNFFMAMNFSKIASPQITSQSFLQMVVMANGVANGLFRFVWGTLLRQFGFKLIFLIVMSINIVIFATMHWIVLSPEAYLVSFFLAGACLGGLLVMIPNLCLLVFGQKIGNEMYSYCWAAFALGNLVQYKMGSDLESGTQYVHQFQVFTITAVIGLIFGLVTKYQGRWENSLQKLTF